MNHCPQTGKLAYPTAAEGWKVLRERTSPRGLLRHKTSGQHGGHVYRCTHCHPWHLTRQTNRHAPSAWPQRRIAAMERAWIEREQEARG